MKVALYARVPAERHAERGTIGSQLQVLRERVTASGDELAGEYAADGQSGARLDRPGLDALATPPRPAVRDGVVPVPRPARRARAVLPPGQFEDQHHQRQLPSQGCPHRKRDLLRQ